jgi:type VI protein secretion system component VasK
MEWLKFWMMKALAELIIAIGIIALVGLFYGLIYFQSWRKQRKCPHASTYETRACDVICSACGLNLGLPGDRRAQGKGGE